jgi:hypothetical protein
MTNNAELLHRLYKCHEYNEFQLLASLIVARRETKGHGGDPAWPLNRELADAEMKRCKALLVDMLTANCEPGARTGSEGH